MLLASAAGKIAAQRRGVIHGNLPVPNSHSDASDTKKSPDAKVTDISAGGTSVARLLATSPRTESTTDSTASSVRKSSGLSTTSLSKSGYSSIASRSKSCRYKTIEAALAQYLNEGRLPEVTEIYRLPELRYYHWIFRYTECYTKDLREKDEKLLRRICDYMLWTGETPPYNPDYIFYTKAHRKLVFHPLSLTRPEFRELDGWKCAPSLMFPESGNPTRIVPIEDREKMLQIIDSMDGGEYLDTTPLTYRHLSRLILDRNHYPKSMEVIRLFAPFKSHKFSRSWWRLFAFGWHPVDREVLHHLAVIYRNLDEDKGSSEDVDKTFVELLAALGPLAKMTFRENVPCGQKA